MGRRSGKGAEELKTSFLTVEARGLQTQLLWLLAAHLPPPSFGNVKDEHLEGCFPTTQAGQHSTHLLQDAFPDLSLPTEPSSFSPGREWVPPLGSEVPVLTPGSDHGRVQWSVSTVRA